MRRAMRAWTLFSAAFTAVLTVFIPCSFATNASDDYSNGWEGSKTFQLIQNQERLEETGASNSFQLQTKLSEGQQRAREISGMLQKHELETRGKEFSDRGTEILNDNPSTRPVAKVVGVGAAFWVGRKIPLAKNEDGFELSSRLEGRSRSGAIEMASRLMNGQLHFDPWSGVNLNVNREVSEIDSRAEVLFSFRSQLLSTSLTHILMPNLALSLGASDLLQAHAEGNARLLYQLVF